MMLVGRTCNLQEYTLTIINTLKMTDAVHQQSPSQLQPVPLMPSSRFGQAPRLKRRKYTKVLHCPGKKYTNVLCGLGKAELVLGILFVILGFVGFCLSLSVGDGTYFPAKIEPGVWCSVPLIACGAVGVHAQKNSGVCVYYANMVLSIISAVMMGVLFIFSVAAALSFQVAMIALQSLLAIGSFSAMVINIVHSAYCCAGGCCVTDYNPENMMYIPAQQPGQQYIQLANGQYIMIQVTPSTAGSSLQNAPLHPNQLMTYHISQQTNENGHNAVAEPTRVSTVQPAYQLPKFPVTFDE